MKFILSPILFLLLCSAARAQTDTAYSYLDSNLLIVPKTHAVCLAKVYKKDRLWHRDIWLLNGQGRLITGSFQERSLMTAEGEFNFYLRDTVIMQGVFHDGHKEGAWRKWMTNGLITDSVFFMGGQVIAEVKYQYHTNNTLWRFSLKTAENEKITEVYDTAGVTISKGRFKDNDGEMYTYYPDGTVKSHSVYKDNKRVTYDLYDEKGVKKL